MKNDIKEFVKRLSIETLQGLSKAEFDDKISSVYNSLLAGEEKILIEDDRQTYKTTSVLIALFYYSVEFSFNPKNIVVKCINVARARVLFSRLSSLIDSFDHGGELNLDISLIRKYDRKIVFRSGSTITFTRSSGDQHDYDVLFVDDADYQEECTYPPNKIVIETRTKQQYNSGENLKDYIVKVDENGTKFWYIKTLNDDLILHREDGPAIERTNGQSEYYLKGYYVSEKAFKSRNKPQYHLITTESKFKHRYLIPASEMSEAEAIKFVNDEKASELSQTHIGEYVVSSGTVTEEQALNLFDTLPELDYLKEWSTEKRLNFIKNYKDET